ncbi:hypothetical protein F4782DRAFT_110735 [Xylaria castorea]|nr:hypothetical protein F4782DRAFT_110735 [Xylaria castorea]
MWGSTTYTRSSNVVLAQLFTIVVFVSSTSASTLELPDLSNSLFLALRTNVGDTKYWRRMNHLPACKFQDAHTRKPLQPRSYVASKQDMSVRCDTVGYR